MPELTERQQIILGIVVREYIVNAIPIGSQTLARRYDLGVSPATIRNELAVLEELGYLGHPHTSAGRMPTVQGYRYFVERLMEDAELSIAEQRMIRHQFHQAGVDPEQWMKLAAAVLAHTARAAALVTAPKAPVCRFKHLEIISIRDPLVLLVLVLQEGTVRQQMLSFGDWPVTQEELSRRANRLNVLLAYLSREEIQQKVATLALDPIESEAVSRVLEIMAQIDQPTVRQVYHEGLARVLQEPEFAGGERSRHVVQVLEDTNLLETILSEVVLARRGVQVIIGGEGGRWEEIRDYSMVLARYGPDPDTMGVVGVLGPTRMPYQRAVPAVRYISQLMSDLLASVYGSQPTTD